VPTDPNVRASRFEAAGQGLGAVSAVLGAAGAGVGLAEVIEGRREQSEQRAQQLEEPPADGLVDDTQNYFLPEDWAYEKSLDTTLRLTIEGKLQCASDDGRNCQWGEKDRHRAEGGVPLSCGEDHKAKWNSTGFDSQKHWCYKATQLPRFKGLWVEGCEQCAGFSHTLPADDATTHGVTPSSGAATGEPATQQVLAEPRPAAQPIALPSGSPYSVQISNPNPSLGERVDVNLAGSLPGTPSDIYLYLKVQQLGGQIAWYFDRRLHDTRPRPWRKGVAGPAMPASNPVLQYKVNYPGKYVVGMLVLPAGSPLNLSSAVEQLFEVR